MVCPVVIKIEAPYGSECFAQRAITVFTNVLGRYNRDAGGGGSGMPITSIRRVRRRVNTNHTMVSSPSPIIVSPGTRIHRSVCIRGVCRNSELRAYQYP